MICNTLLLAAAVLRIDTSVVAFAPMQMRATATIAAPSRTTTLAFATKDDDDDEEEQPDPGMAAAFRQLDNLKSLDDGGDKNKPKQTPRPKKPIDASNVNVQGTEAVSPEKEVQLYKEMVQELEETDEDDLYSNVLKDMGGSPAMTTPTPSIQTDQAEGTLPKTTEDFMNQALDEALKEVKIKNSSSVDSILDDKEIMQEIEAIFERGNEQLMESLEEMRREQVRWISSIPWQGRRTPCVKYAHT